ncbi:MAG: bifunctional fucokinase/L-fucose-1-P-guanylyltransferase [Chlorobi bacterium]|nr:bifunctional fucokinase/L-fucose-1-P-guanylyltransferase [Chlorobiota bacterium]
MQYLLSLPENLVSSFHKITEKEESDWFVASDPPGTKIGSGGGTAFLIAENLKLDNANDLDTFLSKDKKIIIHAGGQSRRLPAYAPSGKILTPIPVFRWSRGQKIDQTLLDLQIPLYEKIMEKSANNTLIASGDVFIYTPVLPSEIPEADVVCFGIWVDPHLAARHGVFFTPRSNPNRLDFMLQKPSHSKIEELAASHLFMMDIGIWLLSDKAVKLLMQKSGWTGKDFKNSTPGFYDLYSSFGTSLGDNPAENDNDISSLSVAVVPLDKGEFYHYGTSKELISSTEKIQNRVLDQRNIWHHRVKPHPSIFVQNAKTSIKWNNTHHNIWIENSNINKNWTLTNNHIITGIPENDWNIKLKPEMCIDIVPVENKLCIRPYGINDRFSGSLTDKNTVWMGNPFSEWLNNRNLTYDNSSLNKDTDIQKARIFPLVDISADISGLINWMMYGNDDNGQYSGLWNKTTKLSAEEISAKADLEQLVKERKKLLYQDLKILSVNYKKSVFYQIDLKHAAKEFVKGKIELPPVLPENEPATLRFRDYMFRSEVKKLKNNNGTIEEQKAFSILRESIVDSIDHNAIPELDVFPDQIVWGRSPARLDIAGGWSDTPPYCIQSGGTVLNLAADLNGQPPMQVFIRLSSEPKITLRSIDNGVFEEITTYEELTNMNIVGSAFSIPRAALCLAGFHPDFCGLKFNSLQEQLRDFGGGFEISLLAAIPKGSGLGTSSILAATVLGALSDFCNLRWSHQDISHRTLILEQLLTTGGGWQDQYGGILPGIKLLESEPGTQEKMNIRWLPDNLFTDAAFKDNWLLYYTGITRVAKNILADIVKGMFLNEGYRLRLIDEIKQHAYDSADYIQKYNYEMTGKMIARSWELNKRLDPGTNTPDVQKIIDKISDYTNGLKLLGAGGGGYMLINAKDTDAVSRITSILTAEPPNNKARFVKVSLSRTGFQVSRS